jgi:hypothetical protein
MIIALMMLLSLTAVSAAENNTVLLSEPDIYVDDAAGSDLNDGLLNSTPVKSIDKAIKVSGEDSTIHLNDGTYSGDKNTRILIDKSLTIEGSENTIIDGENKNYIFTVTDNVKVTFKNIRFINAYKSPESYAINYPDAVYGSAVEIKNAEVIIDNCSFENNQVTYSTNNQYTYGGAISNSGTLTITGSKFTSNIAHSTSGLFSYGGSIYNDGELVINNSEFLKSVCDDFSYGGVIANNANLIIDNTLFKNTHVSQESRGGVIYNTGNFKLTNSIIEDNIIAKANFQYVYGAVYNAGTFTAYSNIFKNNSGVYSTPSRGSGNIYSTGKLNLTYNLFLGNAPFEGVSKDVYINSGEIISLDNNWWGLNENPYSINAVNLEEKVNSWLVLNITPEYSSLNIGDSIDIMAEWVLSTPVAFNAGLIPETSIIINTNEYILKNQAVYTFSDSQLKGLYSLKVLLSDFTQIVEVDVGKSKTDLDVNMNADLSYMDDLNITVNVKGEDNVNPEGVVWIFISDNVYNITLKNGCANYTIHGLNPGTYDVKVVYNGSDNYFKSYYTSKVTVNKRSVYMNLTVPEFFIDESYYVNVNLEPEGSKSTAALYVDGIRKKVLYLYDNKENRISLTGFGEGEYNITIVYLENTYFKSTNASGILKIRKYKPVFNITAPDIMLGESQVIKITVSPEDLRGEAILNINGNNYEIFINDTVTSITIPNLRDGEYNLNLVFDGDAKFSKSTASHTFNVLKYPVTLNVDVNYDENTFKGNIHVKTGDKSITGEVSVYVNYNVYRLNLTNGEADFPVTYDKGTNYIYVYYEGDDYWAEADWNTTVGVADEFVLMSENVTSYEYNDFNYSFRLIEPSGVPLPSRLVTVNFKNIFYNVTTDSDGYGYFKLNLNEGKYLITAGYKNQTVTNTLNVKKIIFNLTSTNASYGSPVVFAADFDKTIKGYVNFTVNGILSEIVNITDGRAQLSVSYIDAGVYSVNAFYVNDYFNSDVKSSIFEVTKSDTVFDLAVSNVISGEDANITLTLSPNAGGSVIFILDGQRHVVDIKDNHAVLFVANISGAGHIVNITYNGDRNYNSNTLNSTFYIKDLRSKLTLTLDNLTYGESFNVTAKLDANTTGNVTFIIGNLNKTVNIADGEAVLSIDYLNAGDYNLSVIYNGDEHYITSFNSTNFKVFKANSTITVKSNAGLGENVLIYAYLPPNASGYVSFSMPGYYTSRNKPVDEAIALWYISPLDTGSYTVKAYYPGDSNYNPSNTTYIINITQMKTRLSVEIKDATVNERIIITVKLTSNNINLNDTVKVKVNSREYNVRVSNGKGNLVIGRLPIGVYSYDAVYDGDENYTGESVSGSFSVSEIIDVDLKSHNVSMYYGSDRKLEVLLTDASNNPIENQIINITLNNKLYQLTSDGEGKVYLDLNLKSGNYTAFIVYSGSDRYSFKDLNVSVEVKSTVEGIDVKKQYATSSQYFAFFLDSNGRALDSREVTFRIGEKSFSATTLPNGISRLNINFSPGNYIIQAINPVTGEIAYNTIIIFDRLMENHDVSQYYTEAKYYKVRAYDGDGNVMGQGKTVVFTVNGKSYNVLTDKNGYASFKINLKPGTYIITAGYGGVTVKNKIIIKSIINAKNLKVKKTAKKLKVKVSLKKVNGKYLKAKKVTLKFKKKTFKAKTNKKGVAIFTIKKKVLNKLKKGKKYSYWVIYKNDKVKKSIMLKK